MATLTKKQRAIAQKVDLARVYPFADAVALVKEWASERFTESVDVAVKLGVDVKKSDQTVRGSVVLPHGLGRTVRVAVFAQGDHAVAAEEAGADTVGFADLADQIKSGVVDFDVLIATPDAMVHVGKLGQVLGPKGLMPNPKLGTVTTDVRQAVINAKSGQARYKTDRAAIVHCSIGKVDFSEQALAENFGSLVAALRKAKPAQSKGLYLQRAHLSTTMGPGLLIDLSGFKS